MRLLNLHSLELETFLGEAPPYAILSHTFRWYQTAQCCFVYLEDVGSRDSAVVGAEFEASRWFTRGWTLQELLAPRTVEFFDVDWNHLGNKRDLASALLQRTPIHEKALLDGDFSSASVAQRMSWAAERQTTRPEDMAYCLLGIFDISMTMLYGEGEKAFIRLQEEILKEYDDHSIFAWDSSAVPESAHTIGTLATHPSFFKDAAKIEPHPSGGDPPVVTNKGIQISLPLMELQINPGQTLGMLSCSLQGDVASAIGIHLVKSSLRSDQYSRTRSKPISFASRISGFKPQKVYLAKKNRVPRDEESATTCWLSYGPESTIQPIHTYPQTLWHHSALTRTMTTNLTGASSGDITTAVVFKIISCGDLFCILLKLKPKERTSQLSMMPLGISIGELLDRLVTEPLTVGPKLELSTTEVSAECNVQLIWGTWMYKIAVAVTDKE
ncbi:hypothetical protein AK830_g1652 [Neonectria ditissima]|uniref:DUF8212 domain-containing protein n=1 Tax=Neonectria ditissima TaxID=78410 RepID=A0A0P7B5J0_9HYPO|nr:hypothetical protein AK830_g1652 [Neonectria ditissima]